MTTESNQPQPAQTSPAPGQSQGQQHRRRRRRRKGFTNGSNKNQSNGHANSNGHSSEAGPSSSGKHPAKAKSNHRFSPKNGHARKGANGNGEGAQGGRRKNKQRRQQTFVGPMDHSYRVVNGNMADVSPSTIEYRGNGQNGFYVEAPHSEPSASHVRADAPTRIFCFIEDLFFLAKIQETARKVGVKVAFVKADKDIVARLSDVPDSERPSLIVFDLNNVAAKPLTLIPRFKNKLKRGTSVIGFLSHLQGDLKAKAIEAGCDMVMPRSAFSQNLPNLLRRHGIEDEHEATESYPREA
jgi:hypothetical protein